MAYFGSLLFWIAINVLCKIWGENEDHSVIGHGTNVGYKCEIIWYGILCSMHNAVHNHSLPWYTSKCHNFGIFLCVYQKNEKKKHSK